MSTFNKALIAALIVQVALALVIRAGGDDGGEVRKPEPLLSDFDKDKVTRIAIFDAPGDAPGDAAKDGAPAKDAGEPVIDLRREASGAAVSWKLASHYGFAAKTSEVEALLDKLAGLRTRGPAVTSQVRHKQLAVASDDYRRKLLIETGKGAITLYVGAPAGSREVSVRIDGQDEVYQVGGLSAAGLSTTPASWVEATFLDVPRNDVDYLSVRNKAGSYELQRTATGGWELLQGGQPYPVPAGKKLNVGAMGSWLNSATRINMWAPADPSRTVDTPLATITLRLKPEGQKPPETQEGAEGNEDQPAAQAPDAAKPEATKPEAVSQAPEEYILEVGAEEEGNYFVRLLGSSQAVLVKKSSLLSLVEMNDDVVLISAEN